MPSNRIDADFTAEQREKVKAPPATLAETLPFLIDLSAEECARLRKLCEKNRSFIVKALAIAEDYPESLPASLSLEEFRTDVELVGQTSYARH